MQVINELSNRDQIGLFSKICVLVRQFRSYGFDQYEYGSMPQEQIKLIIAHRASIAEIVFSILESEQISDSLNRSGGVHEVDILKQELLGFGGGDLGDILKLDSLSFECFSAVCAEHSENDKKVWKNFKQIVKLSQILLDNKKKIFSLTNAYDVALTIKHDGITSEYCDNILREIMPHTKEIYQSMREREDISSNTKRILSMDINQQRKIVCTDVLEVLGINPYNLKFSKFSPPLYFRNSKCIFLREGDTISTLANCMHRIGCMSYNYGALLNNAKSMTQMPPSISIYEAQGYMMQDWILLDAMPYLVAKIGRYLDISDVENVVQDLQCRVLRSSMREIMQHALCYSIESDLINQSISVDNIKDTYIEGHKHYFGENVENYETELLACTHWFEGNFGYYAMQLLGRVIAGQIYVAMCKKIRGVADAVSHFDLDLVFQFLDRNVCKNGTKKSTSEMLLDITKSDISADIYNQALRHKASQLLQQNSI